MAEPHKSSRRTGVRRATRRRDADTVPGTPAQGRELRAQGRKTMARLLDAGLRVFADRGFHTARVDDVVRAARTSHGTFYLYFANKEDLLRALASECALEMDALSEQLGPVGPDEDGYQELRRFLGGFFTTYRNYGPVIRAWMEGHVEDRAVSKIGLKAFTDIATVLGRRMHEAGARGDQVAISTLMAMLERFAYYFVSRRLEFDDELTLDNVARIVHRGFFNAPVPATR